MSTIRKRERKKSQSRNKTNDDDFQPIREGISIHVLYVFHMSYNNNVYRRSSRPGYTQLIHQFKCQLIRQLILISPKHELVQKIMNNSRFNRAH